MTHHHPCEKARQGSDDRPALRVLLASLSLLLIAMFGLFAWEGDTPSEAGKLARATVGISTAQAR